MKTLIGFQGGQVIEIDIPDFAVFMKQVNDTLTAGKNAQFNFISGNNYFFQINTIAFMVPSEGTKVLTPNR